MRFDLTLPACSKTIPTRIRKALAHGQLALVCLLLAAGISGCIFNPKRDKPCTNCNQPIYHALTSPERVLEDLKLSYEARDSVEFKLLYDINYIGTSVDQVTQEQLTFDRDKEYAHIAALAKASTITTVIFQYSPSVVRYTDASDPPGWATIQMPPSSVVLEINDNPNSYFIVSSNEQFEFKFIPTTPDSTSPTDTTWKIVRWTEFKF
jgi:hypothetical protein